jgi:hypothetical protein
MTLRPDHLLPIVAIAIAALRGLGECLSLQRCRLRAWLAR